ncbi:MAG: cation-translocating P-type ATPase [Candidatus Paceibacterota bacterium]|jgi:heavy metal translocating P-type ATPase
MNNDIQNFKKSVHSETALVILFFVTFFFYYTNLLPHEFNEILFAVVGFIGLYPVVKSAVQSLKEKKVNVDLLAAIALFFSFISAEWGAMLFINLMLSGARLLDVYTKRRVHISLESLAKIKPSHARVLRNDQPIDIPLSDVCLNDLVVVNLGEQIPVDGTITKGSATINQASLTGESIPILREVGEQVLSATVVVSGNIIIRAEHIGTETTFEKMIKLVEESSEAKSRMRTSAERFSSWYISIMLAVAIILYGITQDQRLVLAVVLVVCADDIAIAVPLAYIAGIGTAARRGIIVKSADILERASEITTLVVDKTGTLTLGKMSVASVIPFGGASLHQILELAGSICARSTHPVSVAIFDYSKEHGSPCPPTDTFKEIEGRGITGTNKQQDKIIIGRIEFLHEQGVQLEEEAYRIVLGESEKGHNVTLIAKNNELLGVFTLADQVRSEVYSSIKELRKRGIKEIVMLTGDSEGVAKSIAKILHIDKYYSELMPKHKVFVLRDFLGKGGRTVAMVGDGVNDAAVLARADVGIAMGGIGSDAAIESADVVLMQDNFGKIVELHSISKKVRGIVNGNFIIWGVVNAIGLYFVFMHIFGPAQAAAYNFLTDFLPIANALRMFRFKQ